jgi:hypothetical protein
MKPDWKAITYLCGGILAGCTAHMSEWMAVAAFLFALVCWFVFEEKTP